MPPHPNRPSLDTVAAGLLAAFVGFASTFAVILSGLTKVGASPAEAASGLMALSIAMGAAGIAMSLIHRMPISSAWSTPGAALLATTGAVEGGFPAAVGAFLLAGALIVLSGLFKPLGRWVAAIPHPLANAMLAGILFSLCLAPVRAVVEIPASLAIVVAWALVARFKRLYAMPVAVVATAVLIAFTTHIAPGSLGSLWPHPVLVAPRLSVAGIVSLGVPLFIVTMASQNLPGIAVLAANGYRPNPSPLFTITGFLGLLTTPFGGHAVNLAAITAAICAGPDADPDPARRYWAAVITGIVYILFGLAAGAVTAFVGASPPILIEAVAGLALLGALGSALMGAVSAPEDREAAVVTLIVSASGATFLGIGGAFWGLLAGGAVMALARWRRAKPKSSAS